MTIAEAIEKADVIRPNALTHDLKLMWVQKVNSQMAEFMGEDIPWPITEDEYDEDAGATELIVPDPYDELYIWYLCAMIDIAQEDTALFGNDMQLYNAANSEFRRWHRRGNPHIHKDRIKGVFA